MGASAWDTETCIKRAKDVEERGVDGVFMTGPPLDRPLNDDPQKGISYARKALKADPNFEEAKDFLDAAGEA